LQTANHIQPNNKMKNEYVKYLAEDVKSIRN